MPKINVEKSFTLRKDSGETIAFEPGEQTVDKDIADHWFVKAHLVGATFEPKEGSYEYAQRSRALKSEADAAAAAEADETAAQAKAEAEARAADLIEKTNQAIAAVAQQAQDLATKNDTPASGTVTELPAIPLASAAATSDATSVSNSDAEQPQSSEGEDTGQETSAAAAETEEQKAE